MKNRLKNLLFDLDIEPQPSETTCGPTCLSGIFGYYELVKPLSEVIAQIPALEEGGTLGVHLGTYALKHGFQVSIYSHNLQVFDPSWFKLDDAGKAERLETQANGEKSIKTREASKAYSNFIQLGGKVEFRHLTPEFLYQALLNHGPVICGLSATYLYQSKREIGETCKADDLHGEPQGHFVVLTGISNDLKTVHISDPLGQNPFGGLHKYTTDTFKFINAILIGVITYDANLIAVYR